MATQKQIVMVKALGPSDKFKPSLSCEGLNIFPFASQLKVQISCLTKHLTRACFFQLKSAWHGSSVRGKKILPTLIAPNFCV